MLELQSPLTFSLRHSRFKTMEHLAAKLYNNLYILAIAHHLLYFQVTVHQIQNINN